MKIDIIPGLPRAFKDRRQATKTHVEAILEHDATYKDKIWLDKSRHILMVESAPLTSVKATSIALDIEKRHKFNTCHTNVVLEAISVVAERHLRYPLREYLSKVAEEAREECDRNELRNDLPLRNDLLRNLSSDLSSSNGISSSDSARPKIYDILGIENDIFKRFVDVWFLSAIARAFEPGCKVDTVLVLLGAQGVGKSSFFSIVGNAPGDGYFTDCVFEPNSKDGKMMIVSRWIIEWAEFDRLVKRRNDSALKAFLSTREDHVRPPYRALVECFPRQCVIGATTNEPFLFTDSSGSRRYLTVPISRIDIEGLERNIHHILGGYVLRYRAGERHFLTEKEMCVQEGLNLHFKAEWMDKKTLEKLRELNISQASEDELRRLSVSKGVPLETLRTYRDISKRTNGTFEAGLHSGL